MTAAKQPEHILQETVYVPNGLLIRCPLCYGSLVIRSNLQCTLEGVPATTLEGNALSIDEQRPPIVPPQPIGERHYDERTLETVAREIERKECAYFWDLLDLSKRRKWWLKYGKDLQTQLRSLSDPDDVNAVLAIVNPME